MNGGEMGPQDCHSWSFWFMDFRSQSPSWCAHWRPFWRWRSPMCVCFPRWFPEKDMKKRTTSWNGGSKWNERCDKTKCRDVDSICAFFCGMSKKEGLLDFGLTCLITSPVENHHKNQPLLGEGIFADVPRWRVRHTRGAQFLEGGSFHEFLLGGFLG